MNGDTLTMTPTKHPTATRAMAVMAALLLPGCADMPAGWSAPDKVLFSNASTIKIQWDNLQTSESAVREKAIAHCGGRQVEVVDADMDPGTFGLIRSKTWRCAEATTGSR